MPTEVAVDSRLILSDDQVRSISDQFGTPLYVIDEAHLRERVRRYIAAFEAAYPKTELSYASKANSTLAVLAIVASAGCVIDVASEGELRAALAAGVPASRTHLHGNAKKPEEIVFAFQVGVGQIVVDNFEEIEQIARTPGKCPDLVLRLAPGVDPKTSAKISTGQADTKFGFNISDGSAERALALCLGKGLPVIGVHCHVGSQLLDPTAQLQGGHALASFVRDMKERHNFEARVINVGGGIGIRYTEETPEVDPAQYCRDLIAGVVEGLADSGLQPMLAQEPGRWIVGESCVTLYTVNNVKSVPTKTGERTYVSCDGGLSDNPRPAMYGSPYPVLFTTGDGREQSEASMVRVSGKHCETDMLFDEKLVPSDVKRGDLLQVLCTGAYNSSMASNYNRYPRPATVLLRTDGTRTLVQRPETWEEMFARESVPEDLR